MLKNMNKQQRMLLAIVCVLLLVLGWIIFKTPFSTFRSIKSDIGSKLNSFPALTKTDYLKILGSPDGSLEGLGTVYDLTNPEDVVRRDPLQYGSKYSVLRQVYFSEIGLRLQSHAMSLKDWNHQFINEWDEPFVADQIVLTSNHFRFGRLNIGVGSPKWKVQLAYLSSTALDAFHTRKALLPSSSYHFLPPEDRPEDFSLGYRSGFDANGNDGVEIAFRFDENNRVDMMVLNFASGMP